MSDASFVDAVCDFRRHLRLLFMLSAFSILLLLASLPYLQPRSGTFVIATVQLVSFAVIVLVSGGLMVVCARRTES